MSPSQPAHCGHNVLRQHLRINKRRLAICINIAIKPRGVGLAQREGDLRDGLRIEQIHVAILIEVVRARAGRGRSTALILVAGRASRS